MCHKRWGREGHAEREERGERKTYSAEREERGERKAYRAVRGERGEIRGGAEVYQSHIRDMSGMYRAARVRGEADKGHIRDT